MKRLLDILIAAVICALAPIALAQSRNIHENTDPYTGLRTLILEVSTRTCPGDPSPGLHDPEVHLLISATENKDHTVSYFIAPELDHASYTLNLRTRGTMDTLIDGVPGSLTTIAGSTTTTQFSSDRSYLHETIPFSISDAYLSKLGSAGMFQFRINGTRQEVQRCTDSKRLHDVAEFVQAAANYGPPAGIFGSIPESPHEEISTAGQLKSFSLTGIDTYACSATSAPVPGEPAVRLAITAEQHPDHTVKYFIVTDLTHGVPLNLRNKDSINIEMNGASQTFHTPHGSTIDTATGPDGKPFVHETIAFHVDRRDIIALSKSPTLEFSIDGPHQTVQRCTDAKKFQDLAKFINTTATLYDHPVADARHP